MKRKRKETLSVPPVRHPPGSRRASGEDGTARAGIGAETVRDATGAGLLLALEDFPGPVWLQAPDHVIRFTNRRFREISRGAEVRPCHVTFHGRGEPCSPCVMLGLSGVPSSPHDWAAPDGRVYEVHGYPCGAAGGERLVLFLGVDVTGRKEAEAALKESESKYRIVADNAHAWEFWLGPDHKSFLYVSPACMRIAGRPAQAFVDDPVLYTRIIHPDDRPGFVAHVSRTRKERVSEEIAFRIVRPDGSIRWIRHVCQPVFGADGMYLGVRGSNRDITKRMRAELALQESEERFRSLVEHALVGFFLVQEGGIVFLNPEQERIVGPVPEGLPLADLAERVHPGDRERFLALCDEAGTAGFDRIEMDLRFLSGERPGGPETLRWVHGRAMPVLFREKKALLVNTVDVTRAKEFERVASLRDKMAALGQVTAGIAHEIRNPLSGLNLYLSAAEQLLADSESLEPEIRESAETVFGMMKGASGKIEAVIRKVLDFARPAPSRLSLVPVNRIVKEAAQLAHTILRRSGIRLETALAEDLPLCYADLRLLEQVVLNIVTNAAQAMEGRGGEKATRIASAQEGRHVVIRVADSGPGVPEDLRDKIFDPFFTTKKEGGGIGLSFSHRAVTDHGGFLTVGTSALGGAEFRIGIPIGDKRKAPRPHP
jgi:PAS domain S-box-containing protein